MNNNEPGEKKVVSVNTSVKKVVTTTNNKVDDSSLEKTMEEHMQENQKNTKISIDWKTLFIYVVMIAVIVSLAFLLLRFCEKYEREVENTTAPTTKGLYTTTTTTREVIYQTTTRAQTQATHTVFDPNRNR